MNPIRRFGGFAVGSISCRKASKTHLNLRSYLFSIARSRSASSLCEPRILLRRTNVRMMAMFTAIARSLRRNAGQHRDPLFGEGVGQEAASEAAAGWYHIL